MGSLLGVDRLARPLLYLPPYRRSLDDDGATAWSRTTEEP